MILILIFNKFIICFAISFSSKQSASASYLKIMKSSPSQLSQQDLRQIIKRSTRMVLLLGAAASDIGKFGVFRDGNGYRKDLEEAMSYPDAYLNPHNSLVVASKFKLASRYATTSHTQIAASKWNKVFG
jgi:hypothetical protein